MPTRATRSPFARSSDQRRSSPRRTQPVARVVVAIAAALSVWPTNAQGGAWTLGQGRLTLKQTASFWQTDRKFASDLDTQLSFPGHGPVRAGDVIPFDPVTGGLLTAWALTTDIRLGVTGWLELGVSFPLVWMDFETRPTDTVDSRFGLGDVVFTLKGRLWRRGRFVLGGRVDWKVPSGDFEPSVFSVPLTEGQTDVQVTLSAGVSLYPVGYANIDIGWRFRFARSENQRDPGDELRVGVEAGFRLPWGLMLKTAFDALVGQTGSIDRFGTRTPVPRRRLTSLWAGLLWSATRRLTLELSGRYLLTGEDFPAGSQVYLGLSYAFPLWGSGRK